MSNILYSNARARSLENNLLGKERIERMLNANDIEATLKILSEVNFGGGIVLDSSINFENLLYAENETLFNFIKSCSPSKNFTEYFLGLNDFLNSEAVIRSKYKKINLDKLLVENGIFSTDLLKEKILIDSYSNFNKELQNALIMTDELMTSKNAAGAEIDNIFNKCYYSFLRTRAKDNKFLSKITIFKIDSINISISFRTRNFEQAQKYFIDGGKLSLTFLKSLCEDSIENLKIQCLSYEYSNLILVGLDSLIKHEPLIEFEKMVDNYTIDLLKNIKYTTEGIMPFIQYCFYKKYDIINARIILVGKFNKIDKSILIKRLRDYYEG